MRSTILIATVLVLLTGAALAEIPRMISYQGKVTDTSGNPLADGSYTMRFMIYDAEVAGTLLWDSGARSVDVAGGVFSVLLGESPQPVLSLGFDADYWLLVRFAGVDQTPRQRLASTGYAYMASGLVAGTRIIDSIPELLGAVLWAQNTSTTGATDALYGRSDSPEGTGVNGVAVPTTGENRGVYGRSYSSQGTGVYGLASATSGTTNGVRGQSNSADGRGVYGYAAATSGTTVGVMGMAASTSGIGVYGADTQTSGFSYGVYGKSCSSTGTGAFGWAIATQGLTRGVYGRSASTAGIGVFGFASASEGETYGVKGESVATMGTGVFGSATSTVGATFGVMGAAASSIAAGVYGEATHGSSAIAFGGYFSSPSTSGAGVVGYASATTGTVRAVTGSTPSSSGRGVHGEATSTAGTTFGVLGTSASTGGTGVSGYATSSTGQAYGVRGTSSSSSGAGVYGEASSGNGHGVHGEGPTCGVYGTTTNTSSWTYGVYGLNSTDQGAGVYGTGDNCGVYGRATAGDGEKYGVHGYSTEFDGRGVYGQATAYGVYGSASNVGATSFGIYGTTESDYSGSAVYGNATGTFGLNFGVYGTSASPYARAVYGSATATEGTTFGVYGKSESTDGYGVYFSGGLAGSGTKSCVVKTSRGPTLMYCQESPENWFEDFGEGRLINGRGHVDLDEVFLETVTIDGQHAMHVFIEPHGPCKATYVERGLTGFDVIEQEGGASTVTFSYRVVAKRKGFEGKRLDVCRASLADPFLYPEFKGMTELERFRQMCIMSGNAQLFDELTARANEAHTSLEEGLPKESPHRASGVWPLDPTDMSRHPASESGSGAEEVFRLLVQARGEGAMTTQPEVSGTGNRWELGQAPPNR